MWPSKAVLYWGFPLKPYISQTIIWVGLGGEACKAGGSTMRQEHNGPEVWKCVWWQVALATTLFLVPYGSPMCMLLYGDSFDIAHFNHKPLVLKCQWNLGGEMNNQTQHLSSVHSPQLETQGLRQNWERKAAHSLKGLSENPARRYGSRGGRIA